MSRVAFESRELAHGSRHSEDRKGFAEEPARSVPARLPRGRANYFLMGMEDAFRLPGHALTHEVRFWGDIVKYRPRISSANPDLESLCAGDFPRDQARTHATGPKRSSAVFLAERDQS